MKLTIRFSILALVGLIMASGTALGETVYVKGVMKITMRTGPGVDHKIVTMVESGDKLEIIESNDDWSQVRNANGKEGWVLTRYVTTDVPVVLLADRLEKENAALSEALEKIKAENAALVGTRKEFEDLEKAYSLLKKEAASYLTLKKNHDKITTEFQEQKELIADLEKRLGNEDVKWFLSGTGVLVAGILLGMSSRRKKRSSLL